jgi:thiamine transport system ATP-binding protein
VTRSDPEGGLALASVTVELGGTTVLDGLDGHVAPGEVLVVLGPSGSGKSTLLRAIAGLVPLGGGTISWDGHDLAGVPAHRRRFGMVFQDHALFPHLDVIGNIEFGLASRGSGERASRPSRRARCLELLDLVGLAGMAERSVTTLSGGEAQRVALARALAPRPRLLLLDEPFSSLDRPRQLELADAVRTLLTELHQPAVHVTHDRDEAYRLADRLAVLVDGRFVRTGPPDEVWTRPGTAEVARLVGHRTVVAARDLGLDGDHEVAAPAAALHLVEPGAPADDTVRVTGHVVRVSHRAGGFSLTVALTTGAVVELDTEAPSPPGTEATVAVDPTRLLTLGPS